MILDPSKVISQFNIFNFILKFCNFYIPNKILIQFKNLDNPIGDYLIKSFIALNSLCNEFEDITVRRKILEQLKTISKIIHFLFFY